MSTFINITKVEPVHSVGELMRFSLCKPGRAIAKCSVGCLELRRLKLKCTWELTPCLLQIINAVCSQAVATNLITTVVEVASGKSHATALINVRNSAHNFSVKFSLCIYVATLTVAVLAVGLCNT